MIRTVFTFHDCTFSQLTNGHVHKYDAVFGYFVDVLMAVTFLSIVLFQKQNQKTILCELKKG